MAVALVAMTLIAMAFIAVGFSPTPAGPVTLHLHVLLWEQSRARVLTMVARRGRGVLPAAVAALRWEAKVWPSLAVATHPMQLNHGAAPRDTSRHLAA